MPVDRHESDDGRSKKPYERPDVMSEPAFEVLVAGCTFMDPLGAVECDPDFGFYVNLDP